MITLEDCIAMCDLDEAEVLAIAEHEHIPEIAAAALGQYLIHQEHGAQKIKEMLQDDIGAALARNDRDHAPPTVRRCDSSCRAIPRRRRARDAR